MVATKEPVPNFLTNGILVFFLHDHRFLFIQKRYSPDKQNWFTRLRRKKPEVDPEEFTNNNYYVHKHNEVIKIDNNSKIKREEELKQQYNSLVPDTDIWVGLLRLPITEGNINYYYAGKYTRINSTFGGFLTRYLVGLKGTYVTKTKNITNREDVLIERWYQYPDIPENQSIFIL